MAKEKRRGKGEGSIAKVTKTVNGKKYVAWRGRKTLDEIDPRTGKNRHISVNGKTKKEVVDKLREIEMSMLTGTGNYHGECRMTMDQWFQEWLEKYMVNIKSSTRDNYEQKIRLYLSPAMGKVKLKDLSTHMIQSIISEYVNPTLRTTPDLSAKSIKDTFSVLRTCLDQAVLTGLIPRNPMQGTKLPPVRKNTRSIHPFTEEELKTYLTMIEGHKHELLFQFALYTGMRQSEILGLTWSNIDWENHKILVDKQMAKKKNAKGEPVFEETKTDKERFIAVGPDAIACLEKQQDIVDRMRQTAGASCWEEHDLVFPNATGNKLSYRTVYDCHKRIVKKMGCEDTRFHDLRHTYATACIKSGVDIKTLQDNLGHSDVQTTLNIYSHVFDSMKEASAHQVEAYYSELKKEK